LESVDGSHIEDIPLSSIYETCLNGPIFIRFRRQPGFKEFLDIGRVLKFESIKAHSIHSKPGPFIHSNPPKARAEAETMRLCREIEKNLSWARNVWSVVPTRFYFRHVKGIEMNHVKLDYTNSEAKEVYVLEDVQDHLVRSSEH